MWSNWVDFERSLSCGHIDRKFEKVTMENIEARFF